MTINLEVQRKAQAKIDRVVGASRLPKFSDRENLPYVEAVYREVMRWLPPLPMGGPHYLKQDDFYKGYFLPKGIVIPDKLHDIQKV
jgi:cytochrome P450